MLSTFLKCSCLVFFFFSSSSLSQATNLKNSLFPSHRWQWSATTTLEYDVSYKTTYYTQRLDHFNMLPNSNSTFQQRYLVDDRFWGGADPSAPILLYTGNEGDVELFAHNSGFMFEIAPRLKALVVFIEHRYYGKSIPFGSNEAAFKDATTLGHLTTTQALADFATLIIDLKKNLSCETSPVFAFGGSYGGMLAAWLRLKYPHVVMGALSSSSPILQFDGITSPYSFNNIITNDFRSESESCYETIKRSWDEIAEIASEPNGINKLTKAFKICSSSNQMSYGDIVNWISAAVIYSAMTDYPTAANLLEPLPAYPVQKICEAIDDPSTGNDTLAKMYAAVNIYYNHTGSKKCFDFDDSSSGIGFEGWQWQASTELILPTDANTKDSIFPESTYNYTARAEYCEEVFGVKPRPHWITTEFGGHNISRSLKHFASNIIFFNGLRDPWSGGGVLKSLSKSLIAIVAPKGAHHVDLRFSTKQDPEWLKSVRQKEVTIIDKWLKQYYKDSGLQYV